MTRDRIGHCLVTLEAAISSKSFERRSLCTAIERSGRLPRLPRLQETVARLDAEIATLEAEVSKVTDGLPSEEVVRIVDDHHLQEVERRRAVNSRLFRKLMIVGEDKNAP